MNYEEDIYVGYRYFETFPEARKKVIYPFGFGLSYTDFEIQTKDLAVTEEEIEIKVEVTNLGQREGKEVVQIYYSAPQGKLGKPALELGAFQKTRLLAPGETQTMRLSVPVSYMASFDDLGKISRSAYVLEAGTYSFYVGNSSENLKKWDQEWNLSQDEVLCRLTSKCAPCQFPKRLTGDGSYEMLPVREAEKEPLGLPKQDKELLEGTSR